MFNLRNRINGTTIKSNLNWIYNQRRFAWAPYETDPTLPQQASPNYKLIKGINEPEYLDYLKPLIPHYDLLNVQVNLFRFIYHLLIQFHLQIRGYDFPVLEKFESYIIKLTNKLGVTVQDRWANHHKALKIENFRHESEAIDQNYQLNLYERNIQIKHLSAKLAQIYVEILQSSMPPGVILDIHPHSEEHESIRYIKDSQLDVLRAELEEWHQPLTVLQAKHKIF